MYRPKPGPNEPFFCFVDLPWYARTVKAPKPTLCPVCGVSVESKEALACVACSSPHHKECWDYTGGCSLFGCGSQKSQEFSAVQSKLRGKEMTITEKTQPPIQWKAKLLGLQRRLDARSKDLPRTMLAGFLGAGFSVSSYLLLLETTQGQVRLFFAIFLTGMVYGVSSPFLAPSQLRNPLGAALFSLGSFVFYYWIGDFLRSLGLTSMSLIVPLFFLAFLFASSAAEFLAGARSRLGQLLGRGALPARLALSWFFSVSLMVLTLFCERGGSFPSAEILEEIALWGLLAIGTVGPAMEQGKRGYLESLPGDTRSEAELPAALREETRPSFPAS